MISQHEISLLDFGPQAAAFQRSCTAASEKFWIARSPTLG
jgi:hypothetical protein